MQSELQQEAQAWYQSFLHTAATFVDQQPLLASVIAVIVVAFLLYLASKLARVALAAVVVLALIAGILVYTLGPDRARGYLDQLRQGAAAAERP